MSDGKVLFTIRNRSDNMTFLFKDKSGLALRNFNIANNGESKVRTMPITAEELMHLANFVKENAQVIRCSRIIQFSTSGNLVNRVQNPVEKIWKNCG